MKLYKPLNSKGFGHIELVLAVLFIGLFAFVGVRVMGINHAATLTASQCSLLGRTFTASSGVCNKVCASGQGSYVVTSTYDYCSGAVTAASKISASTCATYGRKALISSSVYVGCARRADQKTTAKAPQCTNTANTYYVQSTYDKCAAPTTASNVVSCTITASPVPTAGNTSTYSFTVKNGTSTTYTNVMAEVGTGIGQRGALLKDVLFGTITPGQTKTVATTIQAPKEAGSFIGITMGTPTLNFSTANGCSKTYNF